MDTFSGSLGFSSMKRQSSCFHGVGQWAKIVYDAEKCHCFDGSYILVGEKKQGNGYDISESWISQWEWDFEQREIGLTLEQGHFIHRNIRENRGLYGTDVGKWVDVAVEIQVLSKWFGFS